MVLLIAPALPHALEYTKPLVKGGPQHKKSLQGSPLGVHFAVYILCCRLFNRLWPRGQIHKWLVIGVCAVSFVGIAFVVLGSIPTRNSLISTIRRLDVMLNVSFGPVYLIELGWLLLQQINSLIFVS